MKLDTKDIKILRILQKDALSSVQTIAGEVGLTNNPCWRRIKHLQESGTIKRYTIDINHKALGLKTTAFVTIKIDDHSQNWLKNFSAVVKSIPEIVECHRMTGSVDYMLKILVCDLFHYDDVYQSLIARVDGLADVSATFSMESLKNPRDMDVAGLAINS
ncbi:MAG: Lrp/AsnC family transcriptional regulator [Gammaproteobacteria bacterium]|nr:Lrp/AsnC family transcriptional regulator [Gammaproteobacteria bacterium]